MALEGSIARRYARALLEIGTQGGTFEKLGEELATIARLFQSSPELQQALVNPIFPLSKRKAVLSELATRLQLDASIKHLLLLLMDRGRIARLPDMAREMAALVDQKVGRVRATLTGAREIPEEMIAELRGAIEKRVGKKVILERKQDPALIGGLVAQVGDTLYDGSVRAQLELAKQQLLTE